ncbi:MAG: diguanylate cyclase [Actinobacteria bacterium]|nr:diguanylate cyclase [Actinomycetota bacterium]
MSLLLALLALSSAGVSIIMGSLVLSRAPRTRLNQIFFVLCFVVSCWAFTEFEFRNADNFEEAMLWLRISFFWPMPSAILLHFVLVFTGHQRFLDRKWPYLLIYGPAAVISAHFFSNEIFSGYPVKRNWGWSFEFPDTLLSDTGYVYFAVMALVSVILCLRFFIRQTDSLLRKQAAFALAGTTVYAGTVGLNYGLLPFLQIRIPELSALSFAIAVGGVFGYAIWKYQLFTLTPSLAAETIIETISDALLLIDIDGTVIHANDAALQMLGYSESRLEGMPAKEIFPEGWLKESIIDKLGIYGNIESVSDIETVMVDYAGNQIAISLSSTNMRDRNDQLLGTICIARNISDRKKTDELIRHQSEGLIERNAELTALYEISNALQSPLDRNTMLKRALDTITSLSVFNVEHKGGIFAVEGNQLKLLVSEGHSSGFLEAHKNMTIDDCLCGQAVKTGRLLYSGSSVEDPLHTIRYPEMTDHGHVIVPLKAGDQVTGVLYLYLPAGAQFDERQQRLLEAIGSQLAIAMENARLYEETRALSLHDPLTGLANRRLMSIELEKTMARSSRTGKPFSLVMLDLDHFKNYNDLYGHTAGDHLLAGVSGLILEEIRRIDLGARYGGEEFLLILPDTDLSNALDVAERIRARTEATAFPVSEGMRSSGITVSLGVASWDPGIVSEDILIARADTALYMAKSRGRNRVQSWIAQEPGAQGSAAS